MHAHSIPWPTLWAPVRWIIMSGDILCKLPSSVCIPYSMTVLVWLVTASLSCQISLLRMLCGCWEWAGYALSLQCAICASFKSSHPDPCCLNSFFPACACIILSNAYYSLAEAYHRRPLDGNPAEAVKIWNPVCFKSRIGCLQWSDSIEHCWA